MRERAPNAIGVGERGKLGVRAVRLDPSVEERSAQTSIWKLRYKADIDDSLRQDR